MLFSGNASQSDLLAMPPSAWLNAALFKDGYPARALFQIVNWLSGPAESYATIPLNAAGVAILIYVVLRGRSFDPWLRLLGASALAQHAVALFYNSAIGRYHYLTWILTMLVDMVFMHDIGIDWLARRYPVMSARFAVQSLVQPACIRPVAAAESIVMSKPPVGIANGLTNYGDRDFSLYLRRSFAKSMGYSDAMLEKPVVGIAYTGSGFNNCHRHFPELLGAVKRGVLAAGALPVEFPTISLGEVFLNPTSLKFRNLMSIDTEEMVRAQPMDAVVLMGGCDKTVPAQLMGAVSANKPTVMLIGGPMMTGRHHGERLGACTDCRRFWAQYRAGKIDDKEINEVEGKLADYGGLLRGDGHGLDHGLPHRGARHVPAGHRRDPRRACRPLARGGSDRCAGGETDRLQADARRHHQCEVDGERNPRAVGDRRLDQRDHSSDRDRGARRRPGVAQAAQRIVRHHAGAGEPQAGRQRLYGGFLRRRRHGRADARVEGPAASRRHDSDRRDARRTAEFRQRRLGGPQHHRRTRQAAGAARRAGRAVRQPGAAGRDP